MGLVSSSPTDVVADVFSEPPARSSGHRQAASSSAAADRVLRTDVVLAKTGSIPVRGRYSSSRRLDQDFLVESKVIGTGMNGPVHLATGKVDGRTYAVKSFKKKGLSAKKRNELQSEVEIYIVLDHPHIARLESVLETDEELHLVMEYMAGGELYDRLSDMKLYTEELAASTTHQMLLAVAYIHGKQVAHRDLKLENFLYEKKDSDHLKLIDFGFAKFWEVSTKMSQACGSVHYVAPEVLKHSYNLKADLWSIGVIVYMLVTGTPPFHGTDDEVLKKIKHGSPHFGSRFKKLSAGARDLVERLLVRDPEARLSAKEALEHEWLCNRSSREEIVIDAEVLWSLRDYARASAFKRAVLSMMAWSLNREDRAGLREQFLKLDTENTGTISHAKMKDLLQQNFDLDGAEVEDWFSKLDTDNNQEIAYTEFMAAALQGHIRVHEDVLRKTFSRFDKDDCGQITAENLRSVLGDSFAGNDIDALIKEADTTGNGQIDYDEFLAYFHRDDDEVPLLERGEHTERLAEMIDRIISGRLSSLEESPQAGDLVPSTPTGLLKRKSGLPETPTA